MFGKRLLAAILIVIFLGAAAVFILGKAAHPAPEAVLSDSSLRGEDQSGKIEVGSSPAVERYTNTKYGFTFEYPRGLSLGQFEDAAGETILVQDQSATRNAARPAGMQLFIIPVEEPVALTPAFIEADLPDVLVVNPKKIVLDNKAAGIMFDSNAPAFGGASFEIWFYYQGFVYQISSYPESAALAKAMISTWHFNNEQ